MSLSRRALHYRHKGPNSRKLPLVQNKARAWIKGPTGKSRARRAFNGRDAETWVRTEGQREAGPLTGKPARIENHRKKHTKWRTAR